MGTTRGVTKQNTRRLDSSSYKNQAFKKVLKGPQLQKSLNYEAFDWIVSGPVGDGGDTLSKGGMLDYTQMESLNMGAQRKDDDLEQLPDNFLNPKP